MKKKKSKGGFFVRLFAILAVLVVVVFGLYMAIDKLVVPKYFGEYGISNMHDLVAMVKTLYNSPEEKDMITNGYTKADQKSGVDKLVNIGFPALASGELNYTQIANGFDTSVLKDGDYEFSDREIASILDQMLESGVLAGKLPDLNYIDTININILELIITPNSKMVDEQPVYSEDSAKVSFTFKFDTTSVRNQMAKEMDTPLFLLNMIVPKTLYITVDYNLQKNVEGYWSAIDGHIGVNGRTVKDSEILLDLLIKFIFPESDQMTIEKLSNECGNILIQGMDLLGDIKIKNNIGSDNANGITLSIKTSD